MIQITDEVVKIYLDSVWPDVPFPESVNEFNYMEMVRDYLKRPFIIAQIFFDQWREQYALEARSYMQKLYLSDTLHNVKKDEVV